MEKDKEIVDEKGLSEECKSLYIYKSKLQLNNISK